jgi:uncharacterized membrane protein YkoI
MGKVPLDCWPEIAKIVPHLELFRPKGAQQSSKDYRSKLIGGRLMLQRVRTFLKAFVKSKCIAGAMVGVAVITVALLLLSVEKKNIINGRPEEQEQGHDTLSSNDQADPSTHHNSSQIESIKTDDAKRVDANENMISENRAIEIAKGAHSMQYAKDQPIGVAVVNGNYVVTFPIELKPRELGPDYAAKVTINSHTGEVLEVLVGS